MCGFALYTQMLIYLSLLLLCMSKCQWNVHAHPALYGTAGVCEHPFVYKLSQCEYIESRYLSIHGSV